MTLVHSDIKTADITEASVQESGRVIATLVTAFSADPLLRWTFPEPDRYLTQFPALARAFAGRAFRHGTAFRSTFDEGAALWLPPGVGPDEEAMMDVLQRGVPAPVQQAVGPVLEQMAAHHPHGPHWYLPLIGVDPAYQGRGIGGELLRRGLDRSDEDRLPAYLEATSAQNIRLYERHGFEIVGKIQHGGSPTLWPMLRQPRQG